MQQCSTAWPADIGQAHMWVQLLQAAGYCVRCWRPAAGSTAQTALGGRAWLLWTCEPLCHSQYLVVGTAAHCRADALGAGAICPWLLWMHSASPHAHHAQTQTDPSACLLVAHSAPNRSGGR